ncbi:MAG TPA: hypothetical protein VL981_11455, partial [Candidatus Methylacidiphilales bacterium]|nr:hypothetical protein [Candidatus Methylacidiphilales bacterium]
AEVWNPHAAPDGKGVLIEDLRGGDHANTFYWYTEKGKARTTKIASNSSMLGWLPNTHRSLFSTRMGNENRYQLIDWDTGKTLWDIPCPGKGHNLALGITPDLILFSQAELFDGHGPWTGDTVSYYANMPEWFRALYAIDATNGKVVASRRADPGRILDQGLVEFFCWAGGKFYFVTQNEFTELNFNDIKARRNGWK